MSWKQPDQTQLDRAEFEPDSGPGSGLSSSETNGAMKPYSLANYLSVDEENEWGSGCNSSMEILLQIDCYNNKSGKPPWLDSTAGTLPV